jgi:hypothetical protein
VGITTTWGSLSDRRKTFFSLLHSFQTGSEGRALSLGVKGKGVKFGRNGKTFNKE